MNPGVRNVLRNCQDYSIYIFILADAGLLLYVWWFVITTNMNTKCESYMFGASWILVLNIFLHFLKVFSAGEEINCLRKAIKICQRVLIIVFLFIFAAGFSNCEQNERDHHMIWQCIWILWIVYFFKCLYKMTACLLQTNVSLETETNIEQNALNQRLFSDENKVQLLLQNIPRAEFHIVSNSNNLFEQSSCVICLKIFENSDHVSLLACNHIFCTTCLSNWICLHPTSPLCPICRRIIHLN